MNFRRVSWTWLLFLAIPIVLGCLVGSVKCAQQDTVVVRPVEIWPVEIREVATIEAGPLTGDTVILRGRLVDAATREEIRLGQVVVESSLWGPWRDDVPFEVKVPAMSVITLTVTAPGYQVRQVVMKAHYRRDVTLTVDIPLEAVPVEVD